MIRFCPSVTSFVVYARRCEKCCLFRVCDYIFKRCIDWCSWTENRHGSLWWGYWAAKHTAMRTSIRGRHSLMTTVVSLAEKEREREKCPRKSTNRTFIVSTGEPDYRQYRPADFETCHWDGYACWQRCHSPSWNYHRTYNVCFLKKRNFLIRYL